MTAYYNEFDPKAAAWLRELIKQGHIAPGIVDERSIEDVTPNDLAGFTQCHFFAGIGGWSLALRRAGWPDKRRVWTMSCPCQPFSAAGKGAGFDDERHLWPSGHYLISQCRPTVVLGEQVASKDADTWIDLVHTDMEALDYAFGAIPFPSAGVGAPHIRDRLYWVGRLADTEGDGYERRGRFGESTRRDGVAHGGAIDGMEHPVSAGSQGYGRLGEIAVQSGRERAQRYCAEAGAVVLPSPTNGFWRDADWLYCRDGKWRPVEPGTFPLADGVPARVGRLRGYGNAINIEAAKAFIESYLE
jgi:DNA (cytosine-5)-methyltransferase 1